VPENPNSLFNTTLYHYGPAGTQIAIGTNSDSWCGNCKPGTSMYTYCLNCLTTSCFEFCGVCP
jgi:hypothetical protein